MFLVGLPFQQKEKRRGYEGKDDGGGDKKIERMGQLSYDPVQQLSVRRTSR